jgi:ABC-type transport system involved in multi-copper enzyme maturation permease subunit
MSRLLADIGTVFRRELVTVRRTPGYVVLAVGLLIVLGGLAAVGGGGGTGFVPAVVDLLLPTEILVPLLAIVLGYRALLTDTTSGEFAVIRTYPVSTVDYVLGVLLARIAALVAIVGVPFALVGLYVWLTAAPDTGIFATHSGVDSPLLFVRFLAFVLLLGTAYLSLSAAVSALASSRRSAIALGLLALLVGVLGGDLAILRSLSGGASPSEIPGLLALTPNGAFRGLVFEHVIGVAFAPDGGFVQTGRAVGSLVSWILAGIVVAVTTLTYAARVDVVVERARERLGEY